MLKGKKRKTERKKERWIQCQHCRMDDLWFPVYLSALSSLRDQGISRESGDERASIFQKAYWLLWGQPPRSKIVNMVISKCSNHHTTPASSTTDFLLWEQLPWCSLFVKSPSSVNTQKRRLLAPFLSSTFFELKRCTRILVFKFWSSPPSFGTRPERRDVLLPPISTLLNKSKPQPGSLGQNISGWTEGTTCAHGSVRALGQPGTQGDNLQQPPASGSPAWLPFHLRMEAEEEEEEEDRTFDCFQYVFF